MIALNTVKRLLALMILVFIVSGCGYHNSATQPNRLPEAFREIAFGKVENPTLERWLEPELRSRIRDEITRRGQLTWVERSKAEALINLRIVSLENSSDVRGDKDKTLKYEETLRVRMRITDASDGRTIWNSGTVEVSESYMPGDEDSNELLVVKLMARRLVDRLNQAY